MKKALIILTSILILFSISGCGKITSYNEISYEKLNEMLKNKENFVLIIGSSTCSACKAYKLTLDQVIEKYQLDIKYIDIAKLDDNQVSELRSNFPFQGTPATIFITKGQEKDTQNRIKGNEKFSKIVKMLKKNKYIK